MVGPGYMLDVPAPPSPVKRAFDQRVMPALIDLAGSMEGHAEHLAIRARRAPLRSLGVACALGFTLATLLRQR